MDQKCKQKTQFKLFNCAWLHTGAYKRQDTFYFLLSFFRILLMQTPDLEPRSKIDAEMQMNKSTWDKTEELRFWINQADINLVLVCSTHSVDNSN